MLQEVLAAAVVLLGKDTTRNQGVSLQKLTLPVFPCGFIIGQGLTAYAAYTAYLLSQEEKDPDDVQVSEIGDPAVEGLDQHRRHDLPWREVI